MSNQIGKTKIISKGFEGRSDVIVWDVLQIKKEQNVRITFISTNSKFKQGIRIAVDVGEGYIEVNGQKSKGIQLWEDTAPNIVELKCLSSEGVLSVYNIWDMGRGCESQSHTSGMLIEKDGTKMIYKCNDFGHETNFDKLVFSLEIL
jgi:hypothetical protein